ncbi:uncharacterized protein LOC135388096 [Ornithodoros turicata]|uniref:uncharacterized protein LOC135388096 n=1 Tax=Ornithodoros turicata TaxID=34597 RepID=UPI00313953B2
MMSKGKGGGGDDDSDSDGQDSTDPPYSIPPPPSDNAGTPAPGPTPTTTTPWPLFDTVKHPLPSQPLICTVSHARLDPIPTSVPDGLCLFLMYRPARTPFTAPPDAVLTRFTALASKLSKTRCGIDIAQEIRQNAIGQLASSMSATTDLYKKKVYDYSALDFDITVAMSDADVTQFIGFLKNFSSIQDYNRRTITGPFGYIFVGVSPIGRDSGDTFKDRVQRIINEVKPDAILFLTTYLRTDITKYNCRVSAPSMWTDATMPDQPTFVKALELRNRLTIPANVAQLLSLTAHGRWAQFGPNQIPAKSDRGKPISFDDNRICIATEASDIVGYTCANSGSENYSTYHDDRYVGNQDLCDEKRLSRIIRSSWPEWTGGYDSVRLMRLKMCMAYRDYGFRGGWVMFDLQLSDVSGYCFVDGIPYGFIRAVKGYAYQTQSCDTVKFACVVQTVSSRKILQRHLLL